MRRRCPRRGRRRGVGGGPKGVGEGGRPDRREEPAAALKRWSRRIEKSFTDCGSRSRSSSSGASLQGGARRRGRARGRSGAREGASAGFLEELCGGRSTRQARRSSALSVSAAHAAETFCDKPRWRVASIVVDTAVLRRRGRGAVQRGRRREAAVDDEREELHGTGGIHRGDRRRRKTAQCAAGPWHCNIRAMLGSTRELLRCIAHTTQRSPKAGLHSWRVVPPTRGVAPTCPFGQERSRFAAAARGDDAHQLRRIGWSPWFTPRRLEWSRTRVGFRARAWFLSGQFEGDARSRPAAPPTPEGPPCGLGSSQCPSGSRHSPREDVTAQ